MSLEACAALVENADPDRFNPTLLGTENAQKILFPLYALNVEVSRAPWVTQEPMIAEIRLQWWRDALEEIREGKQVRSHEITEPLAAILDPEGAMSLDKLVQARSWDIYSDPFKDRAEFDAYIDATYGNLVWTAARLIAPQANEAVIRNFAYASGVAAMIRAASQLKTLNKNPLPIDSPDGLKALAEHGQMALSKAVGARDALSKSLDPLLMSGWQARPTFKTALSDPEGVYKNGTAQSEFARRARLLKLSFLGWWR